MPVYFSAANFLMYGLELAGFTDAQMGRMKHEVQLDNFNQFYGSYPHVLAKLWLDLQTTSNIRARLDD